MFNLFSFRRLWALRKLANVDPAVLQQFIASNLLLDGYDKKWFLRSTQFGTKELSEQEAKEILVPIIMQSINLLKDDNYNKQVIFLDIDPQSNPKVIFDKRTLRFNMFGENIVSLQLPSTFQALEETKKHTQKQYIPMSRKPAQQRIAEGKAVEKEIVNVLKNKFNLNITQTTTKEEEFAGIDAYADIGDKNETVQLKFRNPTVGQYQQNDLIITIYSDYHNKQLGTDFKNNNAKYCMLLTSDGKLIYVILMSEIKAITESFFQRLQENEIVSRVLSGETYKMSFFPILDRIKIAKKSI